MNLSLRPIVYEIFYLLLLKKLENENNEIKLVWRQADSSRVQYERLLADKTNGLLLFFYLLH